MLLARFGHDSDIGRALAGLLGEESARALWEPLAPRAEELRFRFDSEVGDEGSEEAIAREILADIERAVEKERFKMKFV